MKPEALLALIAPKFQDDVTGHDVHHIERVLKMARILQSREGGDLQSIELAAVLHDISDHKFNGGLLNSGGDVAREMLLEQNFPEETCVRVAEIVNQVSFKGAHTEVATKLSKEAQIVQDADRLDALGAIGIARTFAYGGFKHQAFYDPTLDPVLHTTFEQYVSAKTTSINHFHEKLLLLKSRLNTPTAVKIAEERHLFLEEFLIRFYKEWDVNIENI